MSLATLAGSVTVISPGAMLSVYAMPHHVPTKVLPVMHEEQLLRATDRQDHEEERVDETAVAGGGAGGFVSGGEGDEGGEENPDALGFGVKDAGEAGEEDRRDQREDQVAGQRMREVVALT